MTIEELNEMTLRAIAAPHDSNKRMVLADAIQDYEKKEELPVALRDDKTGKAILVATWQKAQEENVEPDYRLLWAVFTMKVYLKEEPQSQQPTEAEITPFDVTDAVRWLNERSRRRSIPVATPFSPYLDPSPMRVDPDWTYRPPGTNDPTWTVMTTTTTNTMPQTRLQ